MSKGEITIEEIFKELCGVSVYDWHVAISVEACCLWRKHMKELDIDTIEKSPLPYEIAKKMCEEFLDKYLIIQKNLLWMEVEYMQLKLEKAKTISSDQFAESFIQEMQGELDKKSSLKFTK